MDIITFIENNQEAMLLEHHKPSIILDLDKFDIEVVNELHEGKACLIIRKSNGVSLSLTLTDNAIHLITRELINIARVKNGLDVTDVEALWRKILDDMERGE